MARLVLWTTTRKCAVVACTWVRLAIYTTTINLQLIWVQKETALSGTKMKTCCSFPFTTLICIFLCVFKTTKMSKTACVKDWWSLAQHKLCSAAPVLLQLLQTAPPPGWHNSDHRHSEHGSRNAVEGTQSLPPWFSLKFASRDCHKLPCGTMMAMLASQVCTKIHLWS